MLDSFTNKALLKQLSINPEKADEIRDLCKQIEGKANAPSAEQVEWFYANENKEVEVIHTPHVGTVSQLNTSTNGFYPGGRYPVYVVITKSTMPEAIGEVFEYGIDQLKVLENIECLIK